MSQKELQRMKVVENAVSGRLKVSEAAEMLQLSERQVTRLKGRVTGEAVDWVYRGNRGRSPANAISDEIRQAVVNLALGKYVGFNDSHLQENLTAEERSLRPGACPAETVQSHAFEMAAQRRKTPNYAVDRGLSNRRYMKPLDFNALGVIRPGVSISQNAVSGQLPDCRRSPLSSGRRLRTG